MELPWTLGQPWSQIRGYSTLKAHKDKKCTTLFFNSPWKGSSKKEKHGLTSVNSWRGKECRKRSHVLVLYGSFPEHCFGSVCSTFTCRALKWGACKSSQTETQAEEAHIDFHFFIAEGACQETKDGLICLYSWTSCLENCPGNVSLLSLSVIMCADYVFCRQQSHQMKMTWLEQSEQIWQVRGSVHYIWFAERREQQPQALALIWEIKCENEKQIGTLKSHPP